jgi:3-phenylpropionate/trans-cinnamate dioxygenase ferredoxin subunit
MMDTWIDVCAVDELEPGDYRTLWIDDEEVAVIKCNGRVHAIQDVCTHDGGELTGGTIEGCEIECPRHGARFDIRTGAVLCPPAYEPIDIYPVEIRNGRIFVNSEPTDNSA